MNLWSLGTGDCALPAATLPKRLPGRSSVSPLAETLVKENEGGDDEGEVPGMLVGSPAKTPIEMNMSLQVGPSFSQERLSVVAEDGEAEVSFG